MIVSSTLSVADRLPHVAKPAHLLLPQLLNCAQRRFAHSNGYLRLLPHDEKCDSLFSGENAISSLLPQLAKLDHFRFSGLLCSNCLLPQLAKLDHFLLSAFETLKSCTLSKSSSSSLNRLPQDAKEDHFLFSGSVSAESSSRLPQDAKEDHFLFSGPVSTESSSLLPQDAKFDHFLLSFAMSLSLRLPQELNLNHPRFSMGWGSKGESPAYSPGEFLFPQVAKLPHLFLPQRAKFLFQDRFSQSSRSDSSSFGSPFSAVNLSVSGSSLFSCVGESRTPSNPKFGLHSDTCVINKDTRTMTRVSVRHFKFRSMVGWLIWKK